MDSDDVARALEQVREELCGLRADEARIREEVAALRKELAGVDPGGATPAQRVLPFAPPPPEEQMVTLDQIAARLRMSKRSMEKYVKRMPAPFMRGNKGRASRWRWSDVRPWLEAEFRCVLPERFPTWD